VQREVVGTTIGSDEIRRLSTTRDHWYAVLASTIGWTLDSFDYFVVVMVLTEIAEEFHRTNAEVALTITLTLAFRPVGAFLFGLMADKYGRRLPLMIDVIAFSALSVASGLAPNFTTFLILRALFGIAMGGEWGAGASLVMEKVAPKWRGLLSGVLQQGYTTGNLLASLGYFLIVPHFGWRALFLVGGLPALLALFIRTRVRESEVWEQTHRKHWSELDGFLRARYAGHVSDVFENATRFLSAGCSGNDDDRKPRCSGWRDFARNDFGSNRQKAIRRRGVGYCDPGHSTLGLLADNRDVGRRSVPHSVWGTWRMGCRSGSHFRTGARSDSWIHAGFCVSVWNPFRRKHHVSPSIVRRRNQLLECDGTDRARSFREHGARCYCRS
jgi:hypothetical protein